MINFLEKLNPNFIEIGNFQIKWYAVCILIGVAICYLTVVKLFKRDGYKQDVVDTALLIVLPAGILGARLWWVISEFESLNHWYEAFFIWQGGLAVQGGVVLGLLAGVWYFRKFHKDINVLYAIDMIVPNILIAQVAGRWGNFFNQEVYGSCVDPEKMKWLPAFIREQMMGNGTIHCPVTEMAQPLFLYESICNLIGWVVIVFVLPKFWKKGRKNGDLGCLYFVWYGIVRVIMEPLRHPEFIMQMGNIRTSVMTSILFIVAGVLGMVALRVVPLVIEKIKAKKAHN